jgi:hypothetical protein
MSIKGTERDEVIIDALVWDVPALNRHSSAGAKAFRMAMNPPPWPVELVDDPLSHAARGVMAERSGDLEAAEKSYRALGSDEFWPTLLGNCLLAWMPREEGEESLLSALADVESLRKSQLKSRLLAKLALFAFDRNLRDASFNALELAIRTAKNGSRLRQALRIGAVNHGLLSLAEDDFGVAGESDPLVDQDWIDALALKAARDDLRELLLSRARSPWSWSYRTGRTPIDEIIAAELQSTWAGAWWLRPTLRRQLGAQILRAPPANREILVYGLSMWINGRGSDLSQVIRLAEPQFDSSVADEIALPLSQALAVPGQRERLAETAAALWDLVSEETLGVLLDHVSPLGDRPTGDYGRRFWALAAFRSPLAVGGRFQRLGDEALTALLPELPASAIDGLSDNAAEVAVRAALNTYAEDLPPGATLGAMVLLARRQNLSVQRLVSALPLTELPDLVERAPDAATNARLSAAESYFRKALVDEIDNARRGTRGFGGRTTSASLWIVCKARKSVQRQTVSLLVRSVLDSGVPADLRFDALVMLANLAVEGLLTESDRQRVAKASEVAEPTFMGTTPKELLRVGRLLVLANELSPDDIIALSLLARDDDVRVRELAVDGAKIALRERRSATLEQLVVAGLYDPDEGVVIRALAAVPVARLTEGPRDAAVVRMEGIFTSYGRSARLEVVRAAYGLLRRKLSSSQTERLEALITAASNDRSWYVRTELTRLGDQA